MKHQKKFKGNCFSMKVILLIPVFLLFISSCETRYFKNDYVDNSPTSGKLKVFYDEGLRLHIENQVYTFESQYANAKIEAIETTENEAIQAFYKDSCKAIFISRPLNEQETKAFASKQMTPAFSKVAYTGLAIITNRKTRLEKLSYEEFYTALTEGFTFNDSNKVQHNLNVVIDNKNSAVIHYIKDSILKEKNLSSSCSALNNSMDVINYIDKNPYAIGLIDFAWLSDIDDSLYKAYLPYIDFVAVTKPHSDLYSKPSQSSFKTGEYPFTRTLYIYRRTDDFSLAKGFQTFVAGPKGQTTFLKQGLLPYQQQERSIKVNFEPIAFPNQ
jgi:phosphate transport system substrate-binding protein